MFNRAHRRKNAIACLVLITLLNLFALAEALGQTLPAPASQFEDSSAPAQLLAPGGKHTRDTVPNKYDDAVGNMLIIHEAIPVNQNNINKGVGRILAGYYSPLVFQAAEQGQGADIQRAADNVLNGGLGCVNDTYRGMHQWFADDFIANLIPNAGQLIAKWASEWMDGWIADAAQFLSRVLRVFVLNPNIAVNGLNGPLDDHISRPIRQGADIMYGVAVDLLLLLFILCIWKYWADASWHGRTNSMAAVGRLIFTSGLLLAWPTLYAFDIQITNEMISAIYFNSAQEDQMLDFALAQAVRGGLIAAGAGVTSTLVPVLGKLTMAATGKYIGQVFSFGATLIYVILGSVLIAELVYMLILKAIQTALITAQYFFAPIFLVCFATPDTEGYATGYVKAFIETSLWTFIWVGLLKVMTIILFSDFNPWGKILISIGVLQLMIEVPGFLGRAQISPASDFVSPKLLFNSLHKSLAGFGMGLSSAVDDATAWFCDRRFDGKGFGMTGNSRLSGVSCEAMNPELLNGLNKADRSCKIGPPPLSKSCDEFLDCSSPELLPPGETEQIARSTLDVGRLTEADGNRENSFVVGADRCLPSRHPSDHCPPLPMATARALPDPDLVLSVDSARDASGIGQHYEWEGSMAGNPVHNDVSRLMTGLSSSDLGFMTNASENSIKGGFAHDVQQITVAEGASPAETAHVIYTAAFVHNLSTDANAREEARRAAINSGCLEPVGLAESLSANWLDASGKSWTKTALARTKLDQAMFAEAIKGSQAYLSGRQGNAYSDFLRSRYGTWGPEQDSEAIFAICNPDSAESPISRSFGPATHDLIASGIPIDKDTRAAMQNPTIQTMHPVRLKKAVMAALAYTYPQARSKYGAEHPSVFKLAHGAMVRRLSASQVNRALAMYEITNQEDLCTPMAPHFMSATAEYADASNKDFASAYSGLLREAPRSAVRLGYLPADLNLGNIHSLSAIAAHVSPGIAQSDSLVMDVILHDAAKALMARKLR